MARKRDRAFAMTMAILFFATAFGFSFYVIWSLTHQNNSSSSSNASSQSAANACTGSPSAPTLTAPTAYIPTGSVTALQSTDLTVGTGATAAKGSCLIVKYYGTLATNGTVFDQNFNQTTGFEFKLGAGQVIPGWDQGLVGMKVGGERRLVIPPSLAYGSQSPSATIPANSTLVFVVQLVKIK
ncbi:MAG TPA: FKBP-type peptidyl-prolyl cis-trans isomerase [Candidatus Saccharimonadales bacterium]|nr:FKBP-type peptidyl-prolyl cis-trans isomerase [Candidatus Saccharimonadales bacterium]